MKLARLNILTLDHSCNKHYNPEEVLVSLVNSHKPVIFISLSVRPNLVVFFDTNKKDQDSRCSAVAPTEI